MKLLVLILALSTISCAGPLRTAVAPFQPPETLANHEKVWDLIVAADVIDTPEKSNRIFGTDLAAAGLLPVHLIVSNKGNEEFELDSAQGIRSRDRRDQGEHSSGRPAFLSRSLTVSWVTW
jgi:hypothetical protein